MENGHFNPKSPVHEPVSSLCNLNLIFYLNLLVRIHFNFPCYESVFMQVSRLPDGSALLSQRHFLPQFAKWAFALFVGGPSSQLSCFSFLEVKRFRIIQHTSLQNLQHLISSAGHSREMSLVSIGKRLFMTKRIHEGIDRK